MYAYLKGILTHSSPQHAILEVQGIGYHIFIPYSTFSKLPQIGQPAHFYTSFVVREFSHALYGFLNLQERDVFDILLNVSGVGPKLALSLIGHLPWSSFQSAIIQEDIKTLCQVPGVGKKTAQRLIVELRDKLPDLMHAKAEVSTQTPQEDQMEGANDAVLALVNLGYNQSIAQKAIKQCMKDLPKEGDLALLIKMALQCIQKIK